MKNMRRCLLKTRNRVSLSKRQPLASSARSRALRLQTVYHKLPNRASFQPKIFLLCRPCFAVCRSSYLTYVSIPLSYLRWFCSYIFFDCLSLYLRIRVKMRIRWSLIREETRIYRCVKGAFLIDAWIERETSRRGDCVVSVVPRQAIVFFTVVHVRSLWATG